MVTNGYLWNKYLPPQYLWDGTCGYHAIKNTLNMMYLLNEYRLNNNKMKYTFNDLLNNKLFYKLNDTNTLYLSRNSYIKLNNGIKTTKLLDLKHINEHVDKYNNLYFWDHYLDRQKINSLIKNKINGVYGIIIYHSEWWIKHWYGLVIDINNENINIHVLDSFKAIWPYKDELKYIFKTLELDEIIWKNNYSRLETYIYRLCEFMILLIICFIIIYILAKSLRKKVR